MNLIIPKINIIFDFDGVIINSHKIKTMAFYHVFKSYGKNYGTKAQQYHLNNIGQSRYLKFKYILRNILNFPVDKNIITKLDTEFDNYIEKKIKKLHPSCYLIKFLKNKKKIFNFYISTATPEKKIIKILKQKKIYKFFDRVYGSPNTKKHHIRDIKKNKKKCIFIGDSFEDLKAAKYSNILFILKTNSENISFRKQINSKTINSFKFLEKKLNS